MGKLWKILLFFGALFSSVNFARAEDIPLKSYVSPSTDITLKINGSPYTLAKAEITGWIREKNDLRLNPRYRSEIENNRVCRLEKSIICALTFSARNENHIQKSSAFVLNAALIKKFTDDLSRQVNKDPVDAKLSIDNGKVSVFSLSQKGIKLDSEKSAEILVSYFENGSTNASIDLPYVEKDPEISSGSIENLGITSLIGEGRSDFRGSPKNRIFNINVATNRFNGVLIKPGEEFSFVKVLGEVDGEHGYLPELVIKQDKTEPEFGGGICQVSTTTFRAAIYSGLKITARRNHAYPVSYYNPQGMDATVYVPRPDLRFINDTPGYILIQTEIAGTELIFRFYGTNDNRKTNIIGPKILERKPDGAMKATFTQQVLNADGSLMREDVFNSNYDSPNKYPHPGQTLTQKPAGWSSKEWDQYKKEHNL